MYVNITEQWLSMFANRNTHTHMFLKEVRDTFREIKVIMGKNGSGGELTLLDK